MNMSNSEIFDLFCRMEEMLPYALIMELRSECCTMGEYISKLAARTQPTTKTMNQVNPGEFFEVEDSLFFATEKDPEFIHCIELLKWSDDTNRWLRLNQFTKFQRTHHEQVAMRGQDYYIKANNALTLQ